MTPLLFALALAAPPDSTRSLALTYGGMALADLASTELVLHQGGQERNPFLQDRAVRLGVNAAVVFLSVKGTQKLQRDGHPRMARVVKWAFLGARAFAFAYHMRQLR